MLVRRLRLPSRLLCTILAISTCGCAESQLEARVDGLVPGTPPPFWAPEPNAPTDGSIDEHPTPAMNLGFSQYVPPPLRWRRHSISLGYIGDWPLRTTPGIDDGYGYEFGQAPSYDLGYGYSAPAPPTPYPYQPFSCGTNCDPDFVLP